MKIITLGSGSSGNCYIVDSGTSVIMLEAGLPISRIRRRMHRAGYKLSDLEACLITHEHGDHGKAAKDLEKLGVQLVCTPGTAGALGVSAIDPKDSVVLGDAWAIPLAAEHDAAEPVSWCVDFHSTGERLLFVTDTSRFPYIVPGCTHILMEANHMGLDSMGGTNALLADRVLRSHMSLDECIKSLRQQDLSRCVGIWLIHISKQHGDPEAMRTAVAQATGKPVYIAEEEIVDA